MWRSLDASFLSYSHVLLKRNVWICEKEFAREWSMSYGCLTVSCGSDTNSIFRPNKRMNVFLLKFKAAYFCLEHVSSLDFIIQIWIFLGKKLKKNGNLWLCIPNLSFKWACWSKIAPPYSHNDPDAFTVVATFCFPAGSKCVARRKNTETSSTNKSALTPHPFDHDNWWFPMDHSTSLGSKCKTRRHQCIALYADTRYHTNAHVSVIVLSGTAGELRHHGNCCGRKH